ncbi:hypothetical protein SNE35_02435 [Paucibacter sp. R3-3]|uniref:Uncharacterized protein n=1 Tax=Roseateles agri TaxID=3098619 RepID=A0ABU5DAP4_9BURK|nr:hypothetical protein [Paucibacter sp. R3-3]MDY0743342.1 hypothetical protein [Paucibacter sp. R3-3]
MSPEFLAEYRSRMLAVWEEKSLFFVLYADSVQLGFNDLDAQTLGRLGLPSWAAPNIWLHPPKKLLDRYLNLGEDSNDREIRYDTHTGRVFVNDVTGELLVALSVLDFLTLLLEFAEMIEKSIALCGADAYSNGRIPRYLISKFLQKVEARLGTNGAKESMWGPELDQLSRNSC